MSAGAGGTASSHSTSTEVELQFDAPDLDAAGDWLRSQPPHAPLHVQPGSPRTQLDTYSDTLDWDVYRSRYTLRIRRVGDGAEATLKAFGSMEAGSRVRTEITQALPSPDTDLLRGDGPVSDRLRLMLGTRRELHALFTVETHRSPFAIMRNGTSLASLTLDDTQICYDGATTRLHRIEVEEEQPGALVHVGAFVSALQASCSLTPAATSKFEAGLEAAGMTPLSVSSFGPITMDGNDPAAAFAYAVLRRAFYAFLEHEPGTRIHEDVEALHQMRVATRRLRTTLRTFRDHLPPAMERWDREIRSVAQALGEVRDRDVQLNQLNQIRDGADWDQSIAVGPLIVTIEAARAAALSDLRELLDSDGYASLVSGFSDTLRNEAPAPGTEELSALEVGGRVLRRLYRRFRRDAQALTEDSPPTAFHAVRVRAKRLRYALEPFVTVTERTSPLLAALRNAQDILGTHQDSEVSIEWLHATARERGYSLPPETLFLMGALAERASTTMADARASWPRAERRVRRAWRTTRGRFEGTNDEPRPAAAPDDAETSASGPPSA